MERNVTFKGGELTLVGRNLKNNIKAPMFKIVDTDLNDVTLKDYEGKIKIVTSFPSLDTPVCDLQVKEFNKRAAGLSEEVVVLAISKDLPFAQKRFCDANEIKNVKVLSDYKNSSFGVNYGFLIKELNLLARTVSIIDKNNNIRYIQLVGEVTDSPNYEEVLQALEQVIKKPESSIKEELLTQCKPCEEGALPLDKETIEKLIAKNSGWEVVENKIIRKTLKFKDFVESKYFLDLVSVIAEEQGHHPDMKIVWNKIIIELTTHAAKGLTDNDFIMARTIDELL